MDHSEMLKATQDFLGNLKEDHSHQPAGPIKREIDSVDDFEHLGHDSSPIAEKIIAPVVNTAADVTNSLARDATSLINNIPGVVEEAATSTVGKLAGDDIIFDPFGETTLSTLHTSAPPAAATQSEQPPKLVTFPMDSNLLEMGDTFPDRKEADDKLDKFLNDLSTAPPINKDNAPEHLAKDLLDDFKADANKFTESLKEDILKTMPAAKIVDDLLERYSDSDEVEEEDEFKPSKVITDDFPAKKLDLPEPAAKVVAVDTTEAFKDFDDFEDKEPLLAFDDAKPKEAVFDAFVAQPPQHKAEPVLPVKPERAACPIPAPIKTEEKTEEKTVVLEKKEEPKPVVAQTKEKKAVIEAEAMFCKMGLDAWFNPERLDPEVESLIYWRDPKKSGPVFGGILVVLLALTYFSLISVVAYLSLLGLTGTISFRIYKNIVQAVQKTGDGHPFKEYLELNVALPQDKVEEFTKVAVAHLNAGVSELRRLFLVEDLVDSIKFGVLLWCLTYLGAWFNGMTLIIIAWVALFSLPKVYETNKTQIDANLDIVRSKLAEITSKVKAAVPIGKKTEEKKE